VGLKTFTVGCSHTISTGNFESIKVNAEITYDVAEESEGTLEAVQRGAQIKLKELLRETYAAQVRKKENSNG
jgi:hypothetical protein